MPEPLLHRVKSKLFLASRRRIAHLLDGQYASLLRGRSLEFDDLREYAPGDEVKDIDWKATARQQQMVLVRQYVAERRHRVVFVVDNGRNMAAQTVAGEPKRSVAAFAIGVLAYLAVRHGDEVALVTGAASGVRHLPYRTSERALEAMLHAAYDPAVLDGQESDLEGLLEAAIDRVHSRTLMVVVAAEFPWSERAAALVKRLGAQHELVWLQIDDADPAVVDPAGRRPFDVDGAWRLPDFLPEDDELREELDYATRVRQIAIEEVLERGGVSYAELTREDEVPVALLRMLRTRSHARR